MQQGTGCTYIYFYWHTHGLASLITRHDVAMLLGSVLIQFSFSCKHSELLLTADRVIAEVVLMAEMLCTLHTAPSVSEGIHILTASLIQYSL